MARSKASEPDREPVPSTPKTTKVTAAAASSTSKKQPSSSKSSKSTAFLLLPLLFLAAAVGYGTLVDSDPSRLADLVRDLPVRFLTSVQDDNALPDKYATDLVNMDVRHVVTSLRCPDVSYSPSVLEDGHLVPVTTAMAAETQPDRVFFMLNGRNDGVYVQHNAPFECIGQAAELAAAWLGADRDVMANGVRLYDQMGFPVRSAADLEASRRIVHVLLDFQLWQWPGIEKGHKYVLEDGVVLTTVALSPKVFDVEYFLTQQESEEIMERGMPGLSRSKVDGSNSSKVVSKSRTSHTAFLPDSFFTRNFRKRAASVARLPSPTFAERLQLLKYDAGEFYRQHFDTFHSREFLPKRANSFSVDDYREWAAWATSTLRSLDVEVPEAFREGGRLFPDADDAVNFPNALLELFHASMTATNMFKALFDEKWDAWILDHVKQNETNVIPQLLEQRPLYLPRIVRAWEDELGLGQLRYTFPKSTPNSVSHFFNWVRWAKERVSFLGDACPPQARPAGALYPKYTVEFQEMLLGFLMDDYSRSFVERVTNPEWYEWVLENRGRNHVLFQLMKAFPNAAELAIRAWERRVGDGAGLLAYKIPKYVKHFHPQRYVTLFIYLNNQTKIGGETVFPFALDRFSDEQIERTGMSECSTGLAVPPRGLHASLFYTQTPEGDIDDMSRHGGCPPHEGTKWGSNAFMWDSDADEGADLWTTK